MNKCHSGLDNRCTHPDIRSRFYLSTFILTVNPSSLYPVRSMAVQCPKRRPQRYPLRRRFARLIRVSQDPHVCDTMDEATLRQLRQSGELSDIRLVLGKHRLDLHRFPLIARSEFFRSYLKKTGVSGVTLISLDDLPGGLPVMELVADFCYGIPITDRLTADNVGCVMCAAVYLQMTGPRNLVEVCRSAIKDIAEAGASGSVQILFSCVKAGHTTEWISRYCTERSVHHWTSSTCTDLSASAEQHVVLSEQWLVDRKELSSQWILMFFNELLELKSLPSLILRFVASYLDFVVGLFLENTSSLPAVEETTHDDVLQDDVKPPMAKIARCDLVDECCPQSHVRTDNSTLTNTEILAIFDEAVACLPDDAPLFDVVDFYWFGQLLLFASQHSAKSLEYLAPICACAKVVNKLTLEQVKELNPDTLLLLNKLCKERGCLRVKLTDEYLTYQATNKAISLAHFSQLLQSTASSPRVSYDATFKALEKILKHVGSDSVISESLVLNLCKHIDFSRVSQSLLARAAKNSFIPKEVTLKTAVSLCGKQRQQIKKLTKECADLTSQSRDLQLTNKVLQVEIARQKSSNEQLSGKLQEAEALVQQKQTQLEANARLWLELQSSATTLKRSDPVRVISVIPSGQ